MTKLLLHKTYRTRKPGTILDVPQREAGSFEAIGLGQIIQVSVPSDDTHGCHTLYGAI
jgi:hypothetical protein